MLSHLPICEAAKIGIVATQVQVRSAPALGPIESIPGSFPWMVPRSVCTACTLITSYNSAVSLSASARHPVPSIRAQVMKWAEILLKCLDPLRLLIVDLILPFEACRHIPRSPREICFMLSLADGLCLPASSSPPLPSAMAGLEFL